MDYELDKKNHIMRIRYRLKLANNTEKTFDVKLNSVTLEYVNTPPPTCPDWTKLDLHQCPNCPLKKETSPYCPVAVNCMEAIAFFRTLTSFDKVNLTIETEQRSYSRDTDTQSAASSLLGIIMPTSPCPIMSKLRPMARFHLPFATVEETRYRALSMHLLAQYFLLKQKKTPDFGLGGLKKIYDEIEVVNHAFIERLRSVAVSDSTLNALVKLTTYMQDIHFTITEESVDEIEQLFQAYLKQ